PAAAIVTMVDLVADAGVADTLEARLADARKRHADGEYGTISLLIVELGIRSQWATEHPSGPAYPRPLRNEGGVDDKVDGGARVSGSKVMKQRGVIKVDGGVDRIQADDRMGEQDSATDYCNCARRILGEMRMAGAEYSMASYITHIVKGLPRGYNLMKRMMMVPGTRESLDEDSITSYILQDKTIQKAEQPTELLPQANYAAPTKLNQQQGQCGKPGGGGSGGGRSTKEVDETRSARDKGRGGGGQRQECWICHDPNHLSYECPDRNDSNKDDTKGGRGRSTSRRPHRDAKSRKEKQTSKKTSSTKDVDSFSGKGRGDGEASCSMVGMVEPTVLLAPKDGEDFQAVAAAMQANPMAPVKGHGTVALQEEDGKQVLIPNVLYVSGVQASLLSAGQLKESGVQLQGDGDEMLLVTATGEVLGRARYTEPVLCTNLCPCSTHSPSTKVVALRTIVSAMKSTPDQLHARLAHVGVDTIKSSAKHEVATGLDITPLTGADPPRVSCIGGKLARHTFSDKGSDAEEALVVVHIDLCGPFRVDAKDGSLYFLLLKDRHTRSMWAMVQFMVPEKQRGGKLASKARWGLHLGVSPESKGWEVLDLTDNKVVTSVEVIFYKTLLLEVWKAKYGTASGRTQAHPPTDTSTATVPLLAKVGEPADEDVVEFLPPPPILAPPSPVAIWPPSTPVSAAGDEGSLEALSVALASGTAGGRQGAQPVDQDGKPGRLTGEPIEQEAATVVQSTGEQ
ncbi:unnamed protein product, partial [Closterium sp. NIES-54]